MGGRKDPRLHTANSPLYLSHFVPKQDRSVVFLIFLKSVRCKEDRRAIGLLGSHFHFLSEEIVVVEYRLTLLLSFPCMNSSKTNPKNTYNSAVHKI